MLDDFISTHRKEIIDRAQAKVRHRTALRVASEDLINGVPIFLDQLVHILKVQSGRSVSDGPEMAMSATLHGNDLLGQGFTIAQVVHDYGDVCQSVTDLAL